MNQRQIRQERIRAMPPAQQEAILGLYRRRAKWKRFRRYLFFLLATYLGLIFILPPLVGYAVIGGGALMNIVVPVALLGVLMAMCQLSLRGIKHKLAAFNLD